MMKGSFDLASEGGTDSMRRMAGSSGALPEVWYSYTPSLLPFRPSPPSFTSDSQSSWSSATNSPTFDLVSGTRWPATDLAPRSTWPVPDPALRSTWPPSDLAPRSTWPLPDLPSRPRWPRPDLAPRPTWPRPDLAPRPRWPRPDFLSRSPSCHVSYEVLPGSNSSSTACEPPSAINIVLSENDIVPTSSVDKALAEFRAIGPDQPFLPPMETASLSFFNRTAKHSSQPESRKKDQHCVFCDTNGEEHVDHAFKDSSGRVVCPVLSAYRCKICGATGSSAHTLKYCPKNPLTRGNPEVSGLPPGVPLSLVAQRIPRASQCLSRK